MAAAVLAKHQARARDTHHFRPHDFVGLRVLEHAVLMDARFMRERIRTDDSLIRRHDDAGVVADELADP